MRSLWRSAGVVSSRGRRQWRAADSIFRRSEKSETTTWRVGIDVRTLFPCEFRAAWLSSSVVPSSNEEKNHHLAAAAARGVGQVIFLNSVEGGGFVLISLAIGDPLLATLAGCGSFISTTTARLFGGDEAMIRSGLYGYNGALIGCAASAFGSAYVPYAALATFLGASATAPLTHVLGKSLSTPQFTWVFNAVTLTSLLSTRPLLGSGASAESTDVIATAPIVLESSFVGVSQIFLVDSPYSGIGIVGAIAYYSPKLALHAVGGSFSGCLVGLACGADPSDVSFGLWGYNSALSSMAVAAFFVETRSSIVLSASSAVVSGALFGSMSTFFANSGIPCLTIPFCTVASAGMLLDGLFGLKLADAPHSPEKN